MKWFFTVLMVLGALSMSWGQTLVRYTFDTVGMAPSPNPIEVGVGLAPSMIFVAVPPSSISNVNFGDNFPNSWINLGGGGVPHARSGGGWGATTPAGAKRFKFTIGLGSAKDFTITNISFLFRANNNGPRRVQVAIDGNLIGSPRTIIPGLTTSFTQTVSGFDNLTLDTDVEIIGWTPTGSGSDGSGRLMIDDVILEGPVFFPITLASFTARPSGKSVQLDWRTATELNNDYMEVQHSTDGRHYSKIGSVQGAGTTQEEQAYAFRHETPASGINYYRLLQVDYDGAYEYHGPVSVRMNGDKGGQLSLFPTVASETVEVQYEGTLSSEAEWQVIDLNGRVWQQQRWEAKSASFSLPVQDLPAGMYLLRLQRGREVETVRFVKQ